MAGNREGGLKAAQKNKEKYGEDFYSKIGAKGGQIGRTGGFHYLKKTGQLEKVRAAGRVGGSLSRRNTSKERSSDEQSSTN